MAGVTPLSVASKTVTLAALAAGVLDRLLSVDPGYAPIVDSGSSALGFGIIVYSAYVD